LALSANCTEAQQADPAHALDGLKHEEREPKKNAQDLASS